MAISASSELEHGPFHTGHHRDAEALARQGLLSTDESDEPVEEDAVCLNDWLTLEWMNNCVPHRNCCIKCYDAFRSIPPMSMTSIAVAASGYGVTVTNVKLLLTDMGICGVDLSTYKIAMDSFGIALFLVNGLVVITSCLLSGWTREALCKCLETGIFTRRNGVRTECGLFATIFSTFGMTLLRILMLAGYVMWVTCAIVLLGVFTSYAVLGYLGDWACDLGETQVTTLFEVVGRPFEEFRSLKQDKFCKLSWQVRSELHNISIGIFLCLCAQVNFLCIVVHNRRTARLEMRRQTEPQEESVVDSIVKKPRRLGDALGATYQSI